MNTAEPGSYRVDLDAYFDRTGYAGGREPSVETLHGLLAAHTSAIPFENLDVLLGRRISVEPEAVEAKLVRDRRGGYCFEQNTLLQYVLRGLGFAVTPISARVRHQKPRDFVPARSHLFLAVRVGDEDWLADVGVGSLSLTSAIRLVLNEPQETRHEPRRICSAGAWDGLKRRAPDAVLYHQVRLGDRWEDVAEFTLETMHPIDVEVANWYTSMHPTSHFRSRLIAARSTEHGRLTLQNRELKERRADGTVAVRTLGTDAELLEVLRAAFGLELPAGTRFIEPGPGRLARLEAGT